MTFLTPLSYIYLLPLLSFFLILNSNVSIGVYFYYLSPSRKGVESRFLSWRAMPVSWSLPPEPPCGGWALTIPRISTITRAIVAASRGSLALTRESVVSAETQQMPGPGSMRSVNITQHSCLRGEVCTVQCATPSLLEYSWPKYQGSHTYSKKDTSYLLRHPEDDLPMESSLDSFNLGRILRSKWTSRQIIRATSPSSSVLTTTPDKIRGRIVLTGPHKNQFSSTVYILYIRSYV